MRITRLEPVLLSTKPAEPIRWSGGTLPMIHASIVQVHTDEGITGLGETYVGIFAPLAVKGIVEALEPLVVGEDPMQPLALYQKLYSRNLFWARVGAGLSVIGAIEMALWDIKGKALGLPVHRLLGGPVHAKLPIYASGGLEKPMDELLEEMRRYKSEGFTAIKIRIGMGATRDVRKVEQIRAALGPDIQLMVDAVQGHNPQPWSAAEAIQVGSALAELNIRWFEEPCAATDYAGYAQVRKKLPIPIAGGESSTSVHEFRNFFNAGALDIAQPDVAHAGGIEECRKITALAGANGVEIAFHSWSSSIVLAANYHLAFCTPNCHYLEYPTWGYPLRDELFTVPLRIENGYAYPSDSPGLGVTLDSDLRRKYKFADSLGAVMQRAGA
ncbi:MAG: mandelate racemase/muconate lactonizing enzyme family protein [Bryobacteraceae bacterium]|nr:mandelate racemase/muconate lactonizing enzyme family protein [Bryobacteraceae bacterium]